GGEEVTSPGGRRARRSVWAVAPLVLPGLAGPPTFLKPCPARPSNTPDRSRSPLRTGSLSGGVSLRLFRHALACLAFVLALAPAAPGWAAAPPHALRLVPDHAALLVKIEQPRRLVESVLNLDLVKEVYNIEAVREFYDSTNARRFFQLVTYFEKQLGVSRF